MSGCRNFFQWSCCKIYLSILGQFLKTYFIGRSLFCKVAPIFIDSSAGSRANIQKTNTIKIYFTRSGAGIRSHRKDTVSFSLFYFYFYLDYLARLRLLWLDNASNKKKLNFDIFVVDCSLTSHQLLTVGHNTRTILCQWLNVWMLVDTAIKISKWIIWQERVESQHKSWLIGAPFAWSLQPSSATAGLF